MSLVHYGNARANHISGSFVKKTHPQDFLHIYECLRIKDGPKDAFEAVERMTKLSKIGAEERTSIKRICNWSTYTFDKLMTMIKMFEHYETSDVKVIGASRSKGNCDKNSLTNIQFNKLSRCDENFLILNAHKVTSKEISLLSLIDSNLKTLEIAKVMDILKTIGGFNSKEDLANAYPLDTRPTELEHFIGASIKNNKKNMQAQLLEDYWNKVISNDGGPIVEKAGFCIIYIA